jgi:hypothetical protein
MSKKALLIVMLFLVLATVSASAQPLEVVSNGDKLALLIPQLYGPDGLFVDTFFRQFNHQAHFNSAFQNEFTLFNIALIQQLTALPLPSPASGFTYNFDPALGAFTRSTQSFGPILTERAETIGARKSTFGFSYQYYSFDKLEGVDLDEIPAVFTHDQIPTIDFAFEDDLVTTLNGIDTTLGQFTFFYTYGLANRFDVSVALPIVSAEMSVVSNASIRRISGSDEEIHFFEEQAQLLGVERRFLASGSADGIGDIILRVKGTALKSGPTGMAVGTDVRFPTGDEENLLGSGAYGLKPFFVLSYANPTVSPHINLAYQWNGSSVLAGDVEAGVKEDLPDQFLYAFGAEFGLAHAVTLVVDILGQRVIDAPRIQFSDFTAADGTTFTNLTVQEQSFNLVNGAVGVKVNLVSSLLLDFNVLFALDDAGLRDKVTPLIGFEYTF